MDAVLEWYRVLKQCILLSDSFLFKTKKFKEVSMVYNIKAQTYAQLYQFYRTLKKYQSDKQIDMYIPHLNQATDDL